MGIPVIMKQIEKHVKRARDPISITTEFSVGSSDMSDILDVDEQLK